MDGCGTPKRRSGPTTAQPGIAAGDDTVAID